MPFRLPSSEEKAGYVQQQFDRIARGYDLTNDAISMGMHRSWKKDAVKALAIKPGGSYLDVCCGTGDLSLSIARYVSQLSSKGGKVTGLDFSGNMLEVARERTAKTEAGKYLSVLDFVQGDAQQLPFPDAGFDGAIISFGLRNLTDLQRGINEMARVVRPGGRVVNLDLGQSSVPGFSPLFKMYFRQIVPIIGLVLQNDRQAYTYLPESLNTYPAPDGITRLFENAGLLDVHHVPLALGAVALHYGTVKFAAGA